MGSNNCSVTIYDWQQSITVSETETETGDNTWPWSVQLPRLFPPYCWVMKSYQVPLETGPLVLYCHSESSVISLSGLVRVHMQLIQLQ